MKYITPIALLLAGVTANAGELEDGLLAAAGVGNLDGVNQMLERGAYVDARSQDGWTPLMMAAWLGYTDIVQALIDKGAYVDAGIGPAKRR